MARQPANKKDSQADSSSPRGAKGRRPAAKDSSKKPAGAAGSKNLADAGTTALADTVPSGAKPPVRSKMRAAVAGSTRKSNPRPGPAPKSTPTEEQIRARAHAIYLERGGTPGDPMADWLQAERELLSGATR